MKEKRTAAEKTIVIDIKLTRKVVAMLACILTMMAALIYLALTGERASASSEASPQAGSDGMRRFYVTANKHLPTEAPNACAPGYHFASLWEIFDPSNLKYSNRLGFNKDDSGSGPPSFAFGWVRTGNASDNSTTAGHANCNAWTNDSTGHGTVVRLVRTWSTSPEFGVWDVEAIAASCQLDSRVWCVED